jgi:hypothetical protein
VVLWFLGYLLMLRVLVPRMRDRSKEVSEGRSMLEVQARPLWHRHPTSATQE